MQGDVSDPVYDGKWAKAIATCKHYDAYSLENFKCVSRFCALLLVLLTLLALETWLVPCWPAADVLAGFPACVCSNQAAPAVPAPVCAGPNCDRTHFNAIVTDQELSETYLPAFTRGCVQGE